MARNYKPRSASSASSRKAYHPERAHIRAPRQAQTGTPRVLGSLDDADVLNYSAGASRHGVPSASRGGRAPQGGSRGARGRTRGTAPARGGAHGGGRNARSDAQGKATRGGNSRGTRQRTASSQRRGTPRRQGGIVPKLLLALVVVVLLVGGYTALYFSSAFTITDVKVSGNNKLRIDYVISLAEVPEDSTFLRTDVEGIRARLLAEPWIQNVEVERGFPSSLTLKITERAVAAVVDIVPERATESVRQWIISDDGTWLSDVTSLVSGIGTTTGTTTGATTGGGTAAGDTTGSDTTGGESDPAAGETDSTAEADDSAGGEADPAASDTAAADASTNASGTTSGSGSSASGSDERVQINPQEFVKIPKIRDISPAVRPVAGVVETDEGITNALELLKGFSLEMREMVASISAPDAVKTTLTLYNNVGVAFGTANDIEEKEKAIATLLAEHEGTITYINVRVADRATYRATQ